VRLLDPASGADLGQLGRHGREANRVAVSPDASRAVTLSPDGDLRVWDLDTRREVGRLSGAGPFALAPTGGSLYSVVGGTLRSWDLTTLRPGPPVAVNQVGILATAIAPDGARLVTVQHLEGYPPGHPERSLYRVELTVHDLRTGRAPSTAADTEPAAGITQFSWACVTVSPDARLAVTGSLTGRVLVWDLDRPAPPLVMAGHTTQVLAAAFTPDGRQLLTGGRDGTVRVWDVARRAEVPHIAQHGGEVNGVAVTGDGSRAVSVASNGSVAVWELLPRVMGRAVPCEVGSCWSLGVSPRGDRAVIGSDGVAVVLDLRTGAEIARRALPAGRSGGPVLQTGFSPDDRGIWAIDASGNRVEWEIARDRVRAGPDPTGNSPLFGLAFTQDGACWIGGTPDGEVVARTRGRPAAPFGKRQHRGRVRSAAISADGRWALTGDAQGQIAYWDLEQQRSTGVWQGHRSTVMALSITPDGRRAASAAFDGTLALWDLAASRRLASFTADGGLIAVALSADGRICVAGEQSGRVHALMSVEGTPEDLTSLVRRDPGGLPSS
ncbi:MAG TPA: hypothetical protein VLS92_02725, partial [Acidimicrobiia bacterium]|nr:hypothetical protein [Acidimicrobiia bacterium]